MSYCCSSSIEAVDDPYLSGKKSPYSNFLPGGTDHVELDTRQIRKVSKTSVLVLKKGSEAYEKALLSQRSKGSIPPRISVYVNQAVYDSDPDQLVIIPASRQSQIKTGKPREELANAAAEYAGEEMINIFSSFLN